jgi:hypothetical protein
MLSTYQHNTQVNVVVSFPEVDGAPIAPTEATFEVTDEVGSVVVPSTTITLDPDAGTEVTIGVNPEYNLVGDDAVRAIRSVRLTFITPTGTYTATARYIVEKASLLVLMQNSFQTYEEALLTRMDLPQFDGWDMSDESGQIAALVTSHDRMCRLTFRYRMNQDAVMYDSRDPFWIVNRIRELPASDFAKWPKDFKQALRRAQLYEADQILKGDPVGDKRRSGVVSETIGEAKMFFNARPPLRLALCVQAMETLSPYLYARRQIGRA